MDLKPLPSNALTAGSSIEITVDCSVEHQEYVEDCEVCCQPIIMSIAVSMDGQPKVSVTREN